MAHLSRLHCHCIVRDQSWGSYRHEFLWHERGTFYRNEDALPNKPWRKISPIAVSKHLFGKCVTTGLLTKWMSPLPLCSNGTIKKNNATLVNDCDDGYTTRIDSKSKVHSLSKIGSVQQERNSILPIHWLLLLKLTFHLLPFSFLKVYCRLLQ